MRKNERAWVKAMIVAFLLLAAFVQSSDAEVFINSFPADMSLNEGDPLDLPIFFYGNTLTGKPAEIFIWIESTEVPDLRAYFSASGWSLFNEFTQMAPLIDLGAMLDYANITWPMFGSSPALNFRINICLDGTVDGTLPDGAATASASCGSRVVNIVPKPRDCSGIYVYDSSGYQNPYVSRQATAGQAATTTELAVKNGCDELVDFQFTPPGQGWISAAKPGPGILSITLNPQSLQPNTYSETINLTSGTSTASVYVTLTVASSTSANTTCPFPIPAFCSFLGGGGTSGGGTSGGGTSGGGTGGGCSPSSLSLSENYVSLTATSGQTVADRSVIVSNNCGSTASISQVQASSTPTWLSASFSGSTMTVSVNTTGLAAGSYPGTVQVNAGGLSATYNITLTIEGPCVPSSAKANPASISRNITVGQDAGAVTPPLKITNNCGTALGFTLTSVDASLSSFVTTTPVVGGQDTTGTLNVTLSTANLAIGNYTGNIVVTPTDTAYAAVTIPVSVGVSPPAASVNCIPIAGPYTFFNISGDDGSPGSGQVCFQFMAKVANPALSATDPSGAQLFVALADQTQSNGGSIDMIIKYAGPNCEFGPPTRADYDLVKSYVAVKGNSTWRSGLNAWDPPRARDDLYYQIADSSFETVTIYESPYHKQGCYYVLMVNTQMTPDNELRLTVTDGDAL